MLAVPSGEGSRVLPPVLPLRSSIRRSLVAEPGRPLLVPDLHAHPRLRDLVEVRDLGVRSDAGYPVVSRDGAVLGGLCVADDVPRDRTSDDAPVLVDLGVAASSELAALVAVQELPRAGRRRAVRRGRVGLA